MPWQRRENGEGQRAAEARIDGEDSISRSVRTVERAVENFAALQENCEYYREMAIELRGAFDEEKERAKVFAQQLAEAERSKRTDRERAVRAEERLERSAQTIRELEVQLAAMRAQTDRLVHTVTRLMSVERGRGGGDADMAELLAA